MEENRIIEERKKNLMKFMKNKTSWIFYGILAIIVGMGIYIRSLPIPRLKDVSTGGYTLGPDLDPFLFLRWAKYIVEHGKLFAIDTMRYIPLGYNTKGELLFHPYMMAWLHKILAALGLSSSVEFSAIIYPVIMFALTVIAFFFLVRKIFLKNLGYKPASIIALISSFFLTVLPSLLPRTIAGIPEKESAAFLFLFLAFYFFLCSWNSTKLKYRSIYGVLAGLATAGMALIWGGFGYIFLILSVTVFLSFLLGKINNKNLLTYIVWIVVSFIFMMPFSTRYSLKNLVLGLNTGISLFVLVIILGHLILTKTKLKKYYKQGWLSKIPPKLISLIIISIFSIVILSIIEPTFIANKTTEIVNNLVTPSQSRLIKTVAENKQPYFSEWANNFGPRLGKFPVIFWLFFVGSIYLFKNLIKNTFEKKERIYLTLAYSYFLIAIIFSRFKSESVFNGTNGFSLLFYSSGFIVLLGAIGYYYVNYYRENKFDRLKNIDIGILLLMVYFFLGIVSARAAVRTVMVLVAPAAAIVSYFCVITFLKAKKKTETFNLILSIIIIFLLIFAGLSLFQISKSTAQNHAPTPYTHQWQNAMSWVRENTPENAVFGHWWDYGYWLQGIGERATMLDGGNAISYWNYLMGRHVLTGQTEQEALDVLYNHEVTHLLIDSTDIGKYSAYSSIGSDGDYDRFSWIGTYFINEKQTQETKDKITYLYQGGVGFDEDIIIKEDNKQILLPRQAAATGALIISINENRSYDQPKSVIVYNNKQYRLPLRYLYVQGQLIDFGNEKENTIDAAAYIIPSLSQGGEINYIGAAMYLSPKNMKALWVKLYLFGQEENFELVHSEPSPIHSQYLIPQNVDVGEIIYYQGIQGPIKIWEVNYNGKEKIIPEYTQRDFPEEIKDRKY